MIGLVLAEALQRPSQNTLLVSLMFDSEGVAQVVHGIRGEEKEDQEGEGSLS